MTSKQTGTEQAYSHHHTSKEREGFVLLGDARGLFLSEAVGVGKKILDIGCRDGELTAYYAKGNDVLGVDVDSDALRRAEKKLGIKTQHLDLNGSWDSLPQNHFDAVVAAEIIEHLYYPDVILEKILRVLNDDGILVGSLPNAFSLANRVRLFLGQKKGTPLMDPTHINHFTHNEIQELLSRYFSEVMIVPLGRFAVIDRFWPGMFSYMVLFTARGKKK